MKRQPIGVDDFKHVVDNDFYFVDKTLFIKEIIDDGALVTLITRPRRFGKTLNMSMLKYYFEKTKEDNSYLFKDYAIWKQGEKYIEEQGKYPVIYITLKGIKKPNWQGMFEHIKITFSGVFNKYKYLLDSDVLSGYERKIFIRICEGEAIQSEYEKTLEILSKALYEYHNQKVIILIDEYDTMLNEAYIHGFWEEVIQFMRVFMHEGFKNNIYLHKGVLTGIFRIAKESIFSDLNNLKVCTTLSNSYRQYFGFLEEEVIEMMKYYNIEEKIDKVADWFNGYMFGKTECVTIYNPWSIINYMDNKTLEPYWINTSSNEIIKKLATQGTKEIQYKIQDIMEGREIENIRINENVIYNEIMNSEDNIWSFMVFSGYLKSVKTVKEEDGDVYCDLKMPNKEVYFFFRNIYKNWLKSTIKGGSVDTMLKALLTGDIDTFHEIFATTVMHVLSYNDVTEDKSESFCHAFTLGMLVTIDKEYEINSNRESGIGRYDVMIIPKDINKKGIVIEFKRASQFNKESIEKALELAKIQLEEKKYETELIRRGVKDIIKLAIAFKGKEVIMESL